MAKRVLGNDPFQRGAASRQDESDAARKPTEEHLADGKKADAKKAKPSRKAAAKEASAPRRARAKKPAEPRAAAATEKSAKPSKSGNGTRAKPAPASHDRRWTHAPKAGGPPPAQPDVAEEVLPLREPAAPVTPRRPRSLRTPVMADETGPRTPEDRRVDRALTEALAAEVAEVTAEAAVDDALEHRPEQDEDEAVDRVLATEMAATLAEAAVQEVLDHGGTSPERDRALAATVAAQVAGAAAGPAVDEVLERRLGRPMEPSLVFTTGGEAYEGHLEDEDDEEDQGAWGADAWRRDAAEVDEEVADEEADEAADVELSVSVSMTEDTSAVEPEVELPDETRDEFPPGRRAPLSLVPPSEAERPREPYFTEQAIASEPPRGLAGRASGMLALAREIAGQALASEGLGRAMGAVQGLVEAVRTGLGTGGGTRIDEYGRDASLVENLQPVLDFLYGQYWRVSVQGADLVPSGASILVANHSGALPYDGLVMAQVIARERPDLREPRWLVEDQVFHAPMLGTLFNRLGAVRACPENALRLLDEQRPVVVFPEGYQGLSKPFAERYRLKRFGRGGFVKLALRTGAPIVPVAIVGAEETSPLLGRIPASFLGLPYLPVTGPLPLPAKWSIRFGEPIGMEELAPESAEDPGEVQRLTERTRESIQGMIQSLLRERRSVFAG